MRRSGRIGLNSAAILLLQLDTLSWASVFTRTPAVDTNSQKTGASSIHSLSKPASSSPEGLSPPNWGGCQLLSAENGNNGDTELAEEQPVQSLVVQQGLCQVVSGDALVSALSVPTPKISKKVSLFLPGDGGWPGIEWNISSLALCMAYLNSAFHFWKQLLVLPK